MKELIRCKLNGVQQEFEAAPNETLVQVLRERFHLLGVRESCGVGVCGACTVLVDGLPASSCLMLAAFADGCSIQTVEGLPQQGELHPLQTEFWHKGGTQCGYCTPGFILSAKAMLQEMPEATDEQMLEWLSGNICRCTGYTRILEAVEAARAELKRTGYVGA